MTFEIINPESLGAPKGWNNGMLAPEGGRLLFVAGQAGADPSGNIPAGDFVAQFRHALERIVTVVRAAGGEPKSIGRLTIYVTSITTYRASTKPLGDVYRGIMGRHYPAMALVEVSGLVDPKAVVEIEATAVL